MLDHSAHARTGVRSAVIALAFCLSCIGCGDAAPAGVSGGVGTTEDTRDTSDGGPDITLVENDTTDSGSTAHKAITTAARPAARAVTAVKHRLQRRLLRGRADGLGLHRDMHRNLP